MRAYLQSAAHGALSNEAFGAYMAPWQGADGQAGFRAPDRWSDSVRAFFRLQLLWMTRTPLHCFCGLVLLTSALASSGCADTPQRDYEKSIKDAAARGPGWDVPLTPLPEGRLTVSTFTDDMALDTETIYTWVAPARELRQRCNAKPDAKRDTVLARVCLRHRCARSVSTLSWRPGHFRTRR
jgi:hypothetical protein